MGLPTRVLIADDQQSVRKGLQCLLAFSPQIEVVGEAVNGDDAVCLTAECRPDVILMDVRMPVMDGLEAMQRIKGQWPDIRIVVLTMYPKYRAKAFSCGADAFLLKGCEPKAMQDVILSQSSG